jgi:hypothetical protein
MGGLPRPDDGHGNLVLHGQFTLDVQHQRRTIDLPEQRGIMFVRRSQDMTAKIRDAFQRTGPIPSIMFQSMNTSRESMTH